MGNEEPERNMSRYIQGAFRPDQEHELYQKEKKAGKILLLRNHGILYAFVIRDNRIYKVAREEKETFPIGEIVIGKVASVAKQFPGVFFSLKPHGDKGQSGFLQMKECEGLKPLNRKADGRILCGDELPVQVIKQAKGTKPMQLTAKYFLNGQAVVVKKGSGRVAYSTKCSREEKAGLEEAFLIWRDGLIAEDAEKKSFFEGWDIIFRTNAPAVKAEVWQKEIIDLISQLNRIDSSGQTRTVYSSLYKPEDFYLELIRDQPLSLLEEIVTDEKDIFEKISHHPYIRHIPVRLYEDAKISLRSVYALDTRLKELLSPRVSMKSGAYLVIEPTEALVAVDVNSGKAAKKTEPEAFYFQTNLEAVKEVCYQLSVRNLSGMILVDFINMKDKQHTEMLIEALKKETAKDSVPTRFVDLTRLGLAEITRKKTSRGLGYTLRDWNWKRGQHEITGDS